MKTSQTHFPSLLGSMLFILGAILGLGIALLMGVVTLSTLLIGQGVQAQNTIVLVVAGFEGLLLVVAAFVSIQKFLQKPSADADSSFTLSAWQIAVCVIVAGLAILLGHQISENETVNWMILPALTLPAVLLPILILFGLGIRRIPLGTRWQAWNVLGVSITLVPFILFILEIIILFSILVIVAFFAVSQPDIVNEMDRLVLQIESLEADPEALMDLIAPYVLKPGVMAITLVYIAVLVPLVEELIKPLGVWFFAGQLTSPAQGFALGALSGAAYALIETFGVSPQTVDWATLLLTRIGTGLLHVTTSALMGGAIAFAVRERRYLRLLGTYILAVSLHGLWNASATFYTLSNLAELLEQTGPFNEIGNPVIVGMVVLAIVLLLLLVMANRRMRKTVSREADGEPAIG